MSLLSEVIHYGANIELTGPLAFARVATGSFFAFSGYHKLFNAKRHATIVATLEACRIPFIPVMQWFVPGVEFSAGLGVAFGLLTPLAALGLIAICIVATCTDGIKRVRAWAPIDKADAIDDALYLPEVLYVILLSFFLAQGAGPYSLDAIVCAWL
jgi:putative oxidoreductase